MFVNCLVIVMFDMFKVWFLAKMWCSEVFEVRSYCYVTRLVFEHKVWCSWTDRFFAIFKVLFSAYMWCSESSMFGHSMFGVFEVRYSGVCSKTNRELILNFELKSCLHLWCDISEWMYQTTYIANHTKLHRSRPTIKFLNFLHVTWQGPKYYYNGIP